MQTPTDLKSFKASDYDGFQLIPPALALKLLLLVCLLLWAIEPALVR